MKKQFSQFLLIVFILSACNSIITTSSQNNQTVFEDKNYSDKVGYVQIYDRNYRLKGDFNLIQNINQTNQLILSFDLMEYDYSYVYAKITHCNKDWTSSALSTIEYLDEFNEFPINKYSFSESNLTPYVNYKFVIPSVKKSGNYILSVYREDGSELLFTRRFYVIENQVDIAPTLELSSGVEFRRNNHQIQLDVNYRNLNVINPFQDLFIKMVQNQNLNNTISGLNPSYHDPQNNQVEYQYFNLENNFPGINEFRFFDTRTLAARGTNVQAVRTSSRGIEVFVNPDKSRQNDVYNEVLIQDLNGGYYLTNMELNQSQSQSNYAWVNFKLEENKIDGEVYVVGQFNNWNLNNENRLSYNEQNQSYEGSIYLKQGFYNYMYFVKSPNLPYYYFEGSHQETQNRYEIFVYFREQGKIFDRIVGYRRFSS